MNINVESMYKCIPFSIVTLYFTRKHDLRLCNRFGWKKLHTNELFFYMTFDNKFKINTPQSKMFIFCILNTKLFKKKNVHIALQTKTKKIKSFSLTFLRTND